MTAPDPLDARLQCLLLPLDGSRLAECVLASAVSLAHHLRVSLTLLHVMERGAPATVHGDRHLSAVGEAEAYLASVAARCPRDVAVSFHVHHNEEGNVAKSIVDHAEDLRADLVILSTHGGGGARRVLFGSVAQQVLNAGRRPVLLVRPPDRAAPDASLPAWRVSRLVVPLDGGAEAEQALPVAATVARAYRAQVSLVQVVPTVATLPGERGSAAKLVPTAAAASLELEEEAARRGLEILARRLRDGGVPARTEVVRGERAQGVLDAALRAGADLVVIATHGRTGLDALFAGSVAARIGAKFPHPLLLVRASRSPSSAPA